MANKQPLWKFPELPFGGVWDESTTPRKVGDAGGMVSCSNNFYHRSGSWSKRPGAAFSYKAQSRGPLAGKPSSGVRWYRVVQSPLTHTVVASEGALLTGDDPGTSNPTALIQIATFTGQSDIPVSFAPARDPWAGNYQGEDELIICGFSGPYRAATGSIIFSGSVPNNTNQVLSIAVQANNATAFVTTIDYTVLQTDNPTTVAQNMSTLLNETSAATAGMPSPFLSQSTWSSVATPLNPNGNAALHIGALVSGAIGNQITYGAITSGSHQGISVSVNWSTVPANLEHGGDNITAPLKYDGATVQGLGYQIKQPFTGCVAWHNHVWFWGDPNNPETLFASDINEPEGFTFMTQYGGYFIGPGDGGVDIQNCVPIGNTLYVFKMNSIYAVTGYDFQAGEYQFQITPIIIGEGIPAPGCVAILDNALVFWNGTAFKRLQVGAFETEHIGAPLLRTQGIVAQGDPTLMRTVAGDFPYQSLLNGAYDPGGEGGVANEILPSVAMFAFDSGNGAADQVLVYDDAATQKLGNYAWSLWSGHSWIVGYWIPFGTGNNDAGGQDQYQLIWLGPLNSDSVTPVEGYEFGASPGKDDKYPIAWSVQTGWYTTGTAVLQKDMHRVALEAEATNGALISATLITPTTAPYTITFPATTATKGNETYQILWGEVNPRIYSQAFMFTFTESGLNTAYELLSLTLEPIEEPYKP